MCTVVSGMLYWLGFSNWLTSLTNYLIFGCPGIICSHCDWSSYDQIPNGDLSNQYCIYRNFEAARWGRFQAWPSMFLMSKHEQHRGSNWMSGSPSVSICHPRPLGFFISGMRCSAADSNFIWTNEEHARLSVSICSDRSLGRVASHCVLQQKADLGSTQT